MGNPVVLDAGPLAALINRDDQFHEWAVARLKETRGELLTCDAVISECYFILRQNPWGIIALLSYLEDQDPDIRWAAGSAAAWIQLQSQSEWSTPPQVGKPGVVAIGRDPFAAGFNGERRKPRVLDEIAARVCARTETEEDRPMSSTRPHDRTVRGFEERRAKRRGFVEPARLKVDPWMCADTYD